jgi:hypothetical protein
MIDAKKVRSILGSAGLLLVPLLIYASILPLQFVPLSLDQAIIRWQSTPWLNLGVNNRADWIFNAIVIIPITYFLCGAVGYRRRLGMGLLITCSEGTGTLIGSSADLLDLKLREVLSDSYKIGKCPKLWDGKAAVRIAELLSAKFR